MIRTDTRKHIARSLIALSLFTGTLAASVQAQAAMGLTRSSVNFRKGPSTSYSVIRKLSATTPIDVIRHGTKWSRIESLGETGYISTDYIRFTSTGVIRSRVNLRSQGSLSGTILTKIPKGERVTVLDGPSGGWYKIRWGTKTGYIHKDYVTVDETAALKAELAKSSIGLLFVHDFAKFSQFRPVTAWNIATEPNPAQMLLVTKKKGSVVEIAKARLTGDERVAVPGEVVRRRTTATDGEVIRLTFTDPEVIPYYFVTVKEPGGNTTTAGIRISQRAELDWESYGYDR